MSFDKEQLSLLTDAFGEENVRYQEREIKTEIKWSRPTEVPKIKQLLPFYLCHNFSFQFVCLITKKHKIPYIHFTHFILLKCLNIYDVYSKWCEENGFGVENKSNFLAELKTKGLFANSGTVDVSLNLTQTSFTFAIISPFNLSA